MVRARGLLGRGSTPALMPLVHQTSPLGSAGRTCSPHQAQLKGTSDEAPLATTGPVAW